MSKEYKLLLSITLLALFILNCGDDEVDTPYHYSFKTPTDTLLTFRDAINFRDVDDAYYRLEETIHSEFTFHFDPKDVGEEVPGTGYIIPESWNRGEFLKACDSMLLNAYSIDIKFPDLDDGLGDPGNDDSYTVEGLRIYCIAMLSSYYGCLAEGTVDIGFIRDGSSWRITTIEDHTGLYEGVVSSERLMVIWNTTLGVILALFTQ